MYAAMRIRKHKGGLRLFNLTLPARAPTRLKAVGRWHHEANEAVGSWEVLSGNPWYGQQSPLILPLWPHVAVHVHAQGLVFRTSHRCPRCG